MRVVTGCFSGHRPDKLPGGYDWRSNQNQQLGIRMRLEAINLIENYNVKRFIFGGALGVDQMAFSVCKKLKNTLYSDINLIIAVPFENQFIKWCEKDTVRYKHQLEVADEVIKVDEVRDINYRNPELKEKEFAPEKMQYRNEWMVDHSNFIIAVWNGSKGGTANCLKYVQNMIGCGRTIIRINPDRLEKESEIRYS